MRSPGLLRRDFLKLVAGLTGSLAASSPLALLNAGCAGGRRRPNFVFVLTDDHAHDAMGCAGHPWIRTPGIDRLAAEGVRFSDAFVTSSLCSPSRASFLSGLYPHSHGVVANEAGDLPPTIPTFPQLLQQAGYRTAFVGKWHMARSSRPRPGFDRWVSFNGQGDYLRNTLNIDGDWALRRRYVTDELNDHALGFIREASAEPFLLILAHKAVHQPLVPAPRHAGLYDERRLAGATRQQAEPGTREQEDAREEFLLAYARTLAAVDEGVAAIAETLAGAGRLDDTVLVYAGDNGLMMGEHGGSWDKRAAYEPSIRIPLIVRYPRRFRPGLVATELALNIDLMPTILDLAGVEPPGSLPGLSLADLAAGSATREEFLYEYFKEQGSVPTTVALRTRRYKYITFPENADLPPELYDLRDDPEETVNLAGEPAQAGVLAQAAARLEALKRSTGYVPAKVR